MKKIFNILLFTSLFFAISLFGLIFGTHSLEECTVCDKEGPTAYADPIIRPISFLILNSSNALKNGSLTTDGLGSFTISIATIYDIIFFLYLTIFFKKIILRLSSKTKNSSEKKIFSKETKNEKFFYYISIFFFILILLNCTIFFLYPKIPDKTPNSFYKSTSAG